MNVPRSAQHAADYAERGFRFDVGTASRSSACFIKRPLRFTSAARLDCDCFRSRALASARYRFVRSLDRWQLGPPDSGRRVAREALL